MTVKRFSNECLALMRRSLLTYARWTTFMQNYVFIHIENTLKRIFHAKAAPNQFSHIELLLSVEIKLVK